MRSKTHYVLRFIRHFLLGSLCLLLTLYLFLALGFLGDAPGDLIGKLVSDDTFTLEFRGLRTDIFWSTRADSVIVTDSSGTVVTVADADIRGSGPGFLFSHHLHSVDVGYLRITVPVPGEPDAGGEDTLSVILSGIRDAIVTGSDRLLLRGGTIVQADGTVILDSMYLDAGVLREEVIVLDIDSVSAFLPDFGPLEGMGILKMAGGNVMAEGFTATAPPGSLGIQGTLYGAEERVDLELDGSVSTAFLHSPVHLEFLLAGRVYGALSDPSADLALSRGSGTLFGREASFEIDSLFGNADSIALRGFHAWTDEADITLDGSIGLPNMNWSADLGLTLTGTDISRYVEELPYTGLNGYISASCYGSGMAHLGGRASMDLAASTSSILQVSRLRLIADCHDGNVSVDGSVAFQGADLSLNGTGRIGSEWQLESWSGTGEGSISNLALLRDLGIRDVPALSSAWFNLTGSGSRFGINLNGRAGISGFAMDSLRVGRAVFTGRLNLAEAAGAADDITFSGGATVTGFRMEGMVADTASVQGDLRLRRGDLSASASLRVDSLRALSNVFHAEADIGMEDGVITIDTLMLAGSGDRLYTAGIMVEQGDSTFFTVSDIRAKHSKLRIVSGGYLSGFAFERGIVLDTLWIDPPVGELEMSGRLETGLTSVDARVRDFDLSSFSTFSGLPAGMSGVGNFTLSYISDSTGLSGDFNGTISDPAYGQFSMDSITVSAGIHRGDLDIDGVYAWRNGVRSGLQLRADDVWAGTSLDLMWDKIQWLELEVNDLTDWLFYVLPLPVRTMGASVSARVEYQRHENDYTLEMQASARIRRLYITLLGIELPNVNFYLSYPDSSAEGYNARFTLGSGSEETGNFSSTLRADIPSIFPLDLRDYDLSAQLTEMEIAIPGIGAVLASGGVSAQGSGLKERPVLQGKVQILEGAVGVPQPVSASSSGGSGEMPFDLAIDVSGTGDLWFRTSFADIELAMNLRIFTLERKPTVNGSVSAVRGRITLLQRDFQISEGTVTIIQGTPPIMRLNVTAETTVRSAVSRQEYHIVVHITGTAENPEINLSGTGPGGSVSQEDILTLLAAGLTYGEMQQLNSSAIRSEVESVAQSMLGSLLARNIRHEIGLDTFEISPELMADTTSLVLNVGKYVLPDLYVSYKDDVFSDDPGTVSAQYLFSSDFYVEGSTRTTVHGNQEPTLELHYTIRY